MPKFYTTSWGLKIELLYPEDEVARLAEHFPNTIYFAEEN